MSSLAQGLKSRTAELHRQAERSAFMAALMGGRLSRQSYCLYLRSLHSIYTELETALARHCLLAWIRPVWLPGLARAGALASDLDTLHGPDWRQTLVPVPAALRYGARIRELEQSSTWRLVSHAYVRYLGDLSGGQMLSRTVARHLGTPDHPGTDFYRFGTAEETQRLTQELRAGIELAGICSDRPEELLDEAVQAFEWHQELFADLSDLAGLGELTAS